MEAHDLDDELAILSLRAAEELDRRLGGKKPTAGILKQLGQQLKSASGLAEQEGRAFLYSDPATTEIFAQAAKVASDEQVSDIDDLSEVMKRIISPLLDNENEMSTDDLTMIRTFCLAFHRSMMAHKTPRKYEYEQDYYSDDLRAT
jgi:hypothetical protein